MTEFSQQDAISAAREVGVEWDEELFDLDALWFGMNAEAGSDLEGEAPGSDDPVHAARVALAHLRERPDYYNALRESAEEAARHQGDDLV